ncbi:MAG: hypothetical protein M2R45_01643 [Verrucomicrobia subdivision 3 bacterium]|nr:hypothetical protein [Limisphaerales bacterium]MCS1412794.1 hypothetical protein [Limisphaerales bacterium]
MTAGGGRGRPLSVSCAWAAGKGALTGTPKRSIPAVRTPMLAALVVKIRLFALFLMPRVIASGRLGAEGQGALGDVLDEGSRGRRIE